jgi:2-haloalkanoic acid dehalogenase type II
MPSTCSAALLSKAPNVRESGHGRSGRESARLRRIRNGRGLANLCNNPGQKRFRGFGGSGSTGGSSPTSGAPRATSSRSARSSGGPGPTPTSEVLLDEKLAELLIRHGLELTADETHSLALTWRRLDPWPDAVAGLERLRRGYVLGPLSNGSFALLTRDGQAGGLPWDCIVSTELFGTYKPDRRAYEGAARLLGLAPDAVMLVAAHLGDLRAAAAAGLRTAYVPRPLEWGPAGPSAGAARPRLRCGGNRLLFAGRPAVLGRCRRVNRPR